MTNVVYQAYGKKEVLFQTLFSILSIIEKSAVKDFRIVIYTDHVDFLKKFFAGYEFIHFELLTPELMQKWKGAIQFHHRMKIEILRDCTTKYDGHILYMDGDTYYTQDIAILLGRISENQSVMHLAEHQLNKTKDLLAKKLYKFLKKTEILVNGKKVLVNKDFVMWNAGVIGLHQKNLHIFDSIISYTDELYAKYPKHIMEQYAVSYYAHTVGQIVRSDDMIEHYWNQKDDFEEAINKFFETCTSAKDYFLRKNEFVLPKRHHDKPRYTFKQKLKRKIGRIKYLMNMG